MHVHTASTPRRSSLLALALALAAPFVLGTSGCLSGHMWSSYLEDQDGDRSVPGARPAELRYAARSGDGRYHLEVRYTDDTLRAFVLRPRAGGPLDASLPAFGAEVERRAGALEVEPGWQAIEVAEVRPARRTAGCDGSGGRACGRALVPALRLREGRLELREGHADFRALAELPADEAVVVDELTGEEVGLGALVVLATPFTAALDLGLLYFELLYAIW